MVHTFEVDLNGRQITLETGRVARQANGSVLVRSGDSVVLVTACAAENDVIAALCIHIRVVLQYDKDLGRLALECYLDPGIWS